MGAIHTYYRFKVEANQEDDTYRFTKIIKKGASSPFDNIYDGGKVFEHNVKQSKEADDSFINVNIKFKIEDLASKTSTINVFHGLKGIANILIKQQIRYTVIYRNAEPNTYEVFIINTKWGTLTNYLDKLKQGKLDGEIKKLLAS